MFAAVQQQPTATLAGLPDAPFHRTAPAFAPAAAPAHYRRAPSLPPSAPPAARPAPALPQQFAARSIRAPPPEKQEPQVHRALPASVEVREIVYRMQRLVEGMQGVHFMQFDATSFRKVVSSEEESSVEERMARALELSVGAHATAKAPPPPPHSVGIGRASHGPSIFAQPPRSYFEGLHSQRPRKKTVLYFVKVSARWPQGYGYFHLRVRVVPPARPPVVPYPPDAAAESGLVLEGLVPAGVAPAATPLVPFEATLSIPVRHAAEASRVRRVGAGIH